MIGESQMDFVSEKKPVFKIFITIVMVIWAAYTLNAGFYVDENGLLTIYKGFYQGQRLFVDSWESLQTGGILMWPLYELYYGILSPIFVEYDINVGLVLYTRIAYMIIRGLVALYLYSTIKKTVYENGAFYAALFYFLFIVTWKNFSYKSICDLAVMLIVCFMIRYYETEKPAYYIGIGIATCIAILAYPTMIILAVVIGVISIIKIANGQEEMTGLIAFVATCLIIGLAVIVYIKMSSGILTAAGQLKFLGDQDYEEGMIVRLGKILVSYAGIAVIAYLPIIVVNIIRKIRYFSDFAESLVLSIYWAVFFAGVCLLKADSVNNSRLIYALLIIYFWFIYYVKDREENQFTTIGAFNSRISDKEGIMVPIFVISTATQLIWSISTNQGVEVPGHMCIYVVIAMILLINHEEENSRLLPKFIIVATAFFAVFWVSEGNGRYSDVTKERWIVTEGELKGIALLPEDYEANKAVYNLVSQYVSEDDKLLVAFGSNSTGYLNSVATQGTYSVYARTQKNTKLLDFYEQHPEYQADYVLIDKANSKWEAFQDGETGKYILGNYTKEIASEGNFVLLGR